MNADIIFELLDRCDIEGLLYGLGTVNKEFQKYARGVLARRTSLTVADETVNFQEKRAIFGIGSKLDKIRIVFDSKNPDVFMNGGKFNVSSTDAPTKFQEIFPNVKELCISGRSFQRFDNVHDFVMLFPGLESLKCSDIPFDLAEILMKLPKLKHFSHFGMRYSSDHYRARVPEVLEQLDSYGFSLMEIPFHVNILSKKFVQFECIDCGFYELPDKVRQIVAGKITGFDKQFNYADEDFKCEEFVNLQSVCLTFCIEDSKENQAFFMKMLKKLSVLKKLKTLYLSTSKYSSEEILNCLDQEEISSFTSVTTLQIDSNINENNKLVLRKLFPRADIFYSR